MAFGGVSKQFESVFGSLFSSPCIIIDFIKSLSPILNYFGARCIPIQTLINITLLLNVMLTAPFGAWATCAIPKKWSTE